MPYFTDSNTTGKFGSRGDTLNLRSLANEEKLFSTPRETNKISDIEGTAPGGGYYQTARTREYLFSSQEYPYTIESAGPKDPVPSVRNYRNADLTPHQLVKHHYAGQEANWPKQTPSESRRDLTISDEITYMSPRSSKKDPQPRRYVEATVPPRGLEEKPWNLIATPYTSPNCYRRVHRPIAKDTGALPTTNTNYAVKDVNSPKQHLKKQRKVDRNVVGDGEQDTISHLNQEERVITDPINGRQRLEIQNPTVMYRKNQREQDNGQGVITMSTSTEIPKQNQDQNYKEYMEDKTIIKYVTPRELSLKNAHNPRYIADYNENAAQHRNLEASNIKRVGDTWDEYYSGYKGPKGGKSSRSEASESGSATTGTSSPSRATSSSPPPNPLYVQPCSPRGMPARKEAIAPKRQITIDEKVKYDRPNTTDRPSIDRSSISERRNSRKPAEDFDTDNFDTAMQNNFDAVVSQQGSEQGKDSPVGNEDEYRSVVFRERKDDQYRSIIHKDYGVSDCNHNYYAGQVRGAGGRRPEGNPIRRPLGQGTRAPSGLRGECEDARENTLDDGRALDPDNNPQKRRSSYTRQYDKYTVAGLAYGLDKTNMWRGNKTGRLVDLENQIELGPEQTYEEQRVISKDEYYKCLGETSPRGNTNTRGRSGYMGKSDLQAEKDELNRFVHDTLVHAEICNLPKDQSDRILPANRARARVKNHMEIARAAADKERGYDFLRQGSQQLLEQYGLERDAHGRTRAEVEKAITVTTSPPYRFVDVTGHYDGNDDTKWMYRKSRELSVHDGCTHDYPAAGFEKAAVDVDRPGKKHSRRAFSKQWRSYMDPENPYSKTSAHVPGERSGEAGSERFANEIQGEDEPLWMPEPKELKIKVTHRGRNLKSGFSFAADLWPEQSVDLKMAKVKSEMKEAMLQNCSTHHAIIGGKTVYDAPGVDKITGRKIPQGKDQNGGREARNKVLMRGDTLNTIVGTNTALEEQFHPAGMDKTLRFQRNNTIKPEKHAHEAHSITHTTYPNPIGTDNTKTDDQGPIPLNAPKKWFFNRLFTKDSPFTSNLDYTDIPGTQPKRWWGPGPDPSRLGFK